MRPVRLELNNFLSHEHSVLEFSKLNPITLITGEIEGNPERSNGAGKSSLFDAILFALFGQCRKVGTRKGINLNRLVKENEEKGGVVFDFIVDNTLHRVSRTRIVQTGDKGRSELSLQVQHNEKWRSIAGDKISETDGKIVRLIGANLDTFVNTVLFPQGDISSFAGMKPDERKDVVRSILQLEQYDVYEQAAKDKAKSFGRQLESYDAFFEQYRDIEGQLQANKEQIVVLQGVIKNKEQQIVGLEKKLDRLHTEFSDLKAQAERKISLQAQIEGLERDVREAVTQLEQINEKQEQYQEQAEQAHIRFENFNEEVKRKAGQRPDRQAIAVAAEQNKKLLERWEKAVTDKRQIVNAITNRLQSLELDFEKIDRLEEGKCPTCHNAITADTKAHALDEIKILIEEQQKLLQHAKTELEVAVNTLEEHKAEEQELIQRAEAFNTYIRELKALQEKALSSQERYQGLQTMLKDANEMVNYHEQSALKAQQRLEKVQKEIDKLASVDEEMSEQLKRDITTEGQRLKALQEQLHDQQLEVRLVQTKTKEQETIIEEIAVKRKECFELERKRRVYNELSTAFGKKGIQAIILENCSLEIEEIANRLLHKLTNGEVQVEIQTQRESTTGNIQEVFDILIKSNQRIAPFDLYSGGEGLRIAFAIRIALSTLLARRAGTRISTLWYDEAFAQLDGAGRNQLLEAFQILSDEFDYQLVISHRTDLRTEFEDVITITKQGNSSTIIQ